MSMARIELKIIFKIGVAEGLFTWSDLTYFKSLSYSKHGRNWIIKSWLIIYDSLFMTHNLWAKFTQKQVVSDENKAVEPNRFFYTRSQNPYKNYNIINKNNLATVLFTPPATRFDFKYKSNIAIQWKNAFIYWNNNLYSRYYRILATSIWCTIWWKFFRLVLLTLQHRDFIETCNTALGKSRLGSETGIRVVGKF